MCFVLVLNQALKQHEVSKLTSEPTVLTVLCRAGLATESFPFTGLLATEAGTTLTT